MDIALVTGSTRGIGYETALALGRYGYKVIVTGRSTEGLAATAKNLREAGVIVEPEQLDVTSIDSVNRVANVVANRHGRLDVLVNNAGVAGEWNAPDADYVHPDAVRRTIDTNVVGAFYTIEAFLPLLRNSPGARIVNVSSFMGSLAVQTQSGPDDLIVPAYQASKAALNSITITLAKALAATPIAVFSVDPGFVKTDFSPINRAQAPLDAAQGAEPIVKAALGDVDAESGSFINRDGHHPW